MQVLLSLTLATHLRHYIILTLCYIISISIKYSLWDYHLLFSLLSNYNWSCVYSNNTVHSAADSFSSVISQAMDLTILLGSTRQSKFQILVLALMLLSQHINKHLLNYYCHNYHHLKHKQSWLVNTLLQTNFHDKLTANNVCKNLLHNVWMALALTLSFLPPMQIHFCKVAVDTLNKQLQFPCCWTVSCWG